MQQTEALKIYGSVMRDDSAVILMTNVHGRPSAFSGPKQDFICGPKKFLTLLKNNNWVNTDTIFHSVFSRGRGFEASLSFGFRFATYAYVMNQDDFSSE